jgi:hypothetical protein
MKSKPSPGDTVRALPSIDGATWCVVDCTCELCVRGRHVAVNEPSLAEGYVPTTAAPAERPRWRHITYTSLEAVKVPPGHDELPLTPRALT